ncbi:MAG: DUF3089 domain-containing protein, partial [Acidimicrobiales bacterium]|nr:DUF3089 domain-containing protein [Acidimicrobiales bacterium]
MLTRVRTGRRCGTLALASAALAVGVLCVPVPAVASAPGSGAVARALGAASTTVWLCKPGQANDPCAHSPATTTVTAQGTTSVSTPSPSATAHEFDCFYVYPTVSTEPGPNANLAIQPAEVDAAVAQASQFSQVCKVWAPMYRQATEAALESGAGFGPSVIATAYDSVLS